MHDTPAVGGHFVEDAAPDPSGSIRLFPARHAIFHCHIPKTAGTSVYRFFTEIFEPSACFGWNEFIRPQDFERVFSRYSIVSGHYRNSLAVNSPNIHKITFVRHPISRIVSIYNYLRTLSVYDAITKNDVKILLAHEHDFDKFVRSNHPSVVDNVHNGMSRMLLSPETIAQHDGDYSTLGKLAIEEIDKFAFAGLFEDYKSSLYKLSRILQIPEPSIFYQEKRSLNKDTENTFALSTEGHNFLIGVNQADLMLYEHVAANFIIQEDENHYCPGPLPVKRLKVLPRQIIAPGLGNAEARSVLFAGWHEPEQEGVWGRGRRMSLSFDVSHPCRTIIMKIVPFVAPSAPRLTMTMRIGLREAARYLFCVPYGVEISPREAEGASIVPTLPGQIVELVVQCDPALEGTTNVQMTVDRAVSPASVGASGDARPLSIRLQSLMLA